MVCWLFRSADAARLFQYSLCRVVLMVSVCDRIAEIFFTFQYSLCRVVLMVSGHTENPEPHAYSFSTRSVESF